MSDWSLNGYVRREPDDEASRKVSDAMRLQKSYAADAWDVTQELLDDLKEMDFPTATVDSTELLDFETEWVDEPLPQANLSRLHLERPTSPMPEMGEWRDLPSRSGLHIPEYTLVQPEFPSREPVSIVWPDDPGDAPTQTDPVMPQAREFSLPDVPVFSPIVLPAPPEREVRHFMGERPSTAYLTPPGELVLRYDEPEFQSAVREQLSAKLREGLELFSFSLPRELQSIWEAKRSRLQEDLAARLREVRTAEAARGHRLPQGALWGRESQVHTEFARREDQLSKEMGELALSHLQFIVDKCLQLSQQELDQHNAIANRAFESARATADVALRMLAAEDARYAALVAGYRADGEVFGQLVQAVLADLEGFKARLEGVKLEQAQQESLQRLYVSQLEGVNLLINLYKTEMEGARLHVDVENGRIDGYAKKVDAYLGRLNAISAQLGVRQTELEGDETRARTFKEMVNAYATRVEAAKAGAEVEQKDADIALQYNRSVSEKYSAELNAWLGERQNFIKDAEAQGVAIRTEADAYSALVQAWTAKNDGKVKELVTKADIYTKKAEIELKALEFNTEAQQLNGQLRLGAIEAGTRVGSQVVASALGAIHAGASVSYSSGLHQSQSVSLSESKSSNLNVTA